MESFSHLITNTILKQVEEEDKGPYYMRWRFLETIPICAIGLVLDTIFVLMGLLACLFTFCKVPIVVDFTLTSLKGMLLGIADLMRAIEGVSMPSSHKAKSAFSFLFEDEEKTP